MPAASIRTTAAVVATIRTPMRGFGMYLGLLLLSYGCGTSSDSPSSAAQAFAGKLGQPVVEFNDGASLISDYVVPLSSDPVMLITIPAGWTKDATPPDAKGDSDATGFRFLSQYQLERDGRALCSVSVEQLESLVEYYPKSRAASLPSEVRNGNESLLRIVSSCGA